MGGFPSLVRGEIAEIAPPGNSITGEAAFLHLRVSRHAMDCPGNYTLDIVCAGVLQPACDFDQFRWAQRSDRQSHGPAVSEQLASLPEQKQPIYAVVDSEWAPKEGAIGDGVGSRRIALGRVQVQPGMVTVVTGRIWR